MILNYSVSRTVKVGRKKTREVISGKLTVSGNLSDVGFRQKVQGLLNTKHPGFSMIGYAIPESVPLAVRIAIEFGHNCCEKGMSLEATMEKAEEKFSRA